MGPTPVMLWGGPLIVGQPLTWPPQPSLVGYWLPPPPAGHPGQSFSTPPPPFGYEYWPPSPWGMPPWMTLTSQPQQPSSSPSTVSHLCLLSIVPFLIRANVECLAYSSIYVFKRPSSSVRRDFADTVLNVGGSDEGNGGGNDNDAAS